MQILNVQREPKTPPRPLLPDSKVNVKDTSVIVLTDADRNAVEGIEDVPFEYTTHRDFKMDQKDFHAATYVLYISPSGRIKVLKERYPISR